MTSQPPLVCVALSQVRLQEILVHALQSRGYRVTAAPLNPELAQSFQQTLPDLLILEVFPPEESALQLAQQLLQQFPTLSILPLSSQQTLPALQAALSMGACGWVRLPVRTNEFLDTVHACLERKRLLRERILLEARRATTSLARRISELESLARLAQVITSSLDLESVLTAVVGAAVELTGAEEGCLMLLDEPGGELTMRAARNFNEEFVRTFRLPVNDSLAGNVLRTARPVLLDERSLTKIATNYLVTSLAYVPLTLHERVFGVLGVDNRSERPPLGERDVKLLSALAEYTVIALENARLFETATREQNKLAAVLENIQDGVLVIDTHDRLLLANPAAHKTLRLEEEGQSLPLARLLERLVPQDPLGWHELELDDERIFSVQTAPIAGVGRVITLHDITHLRKLERMKSDFVDSVMHDLRSPLTSVLGYIELIQRVGETNARQAEFIQRAVSSVKNISRLADDLLNLSQIESGMDQRMTQVALQPLVHAAVEEFLPQMDAQGLQWTLELPQEEITLRANPLHLRQMLQNLLANAVKFTPQGGSVRLTAEKVEDQLLLRVIDSGVGIPEDEQPQIFNKFYRASNVAGQVQGTGLGLSIVKSVVEEHRGRVWVESQPGKGSAFCILLPLPPAQRKDGGGQLSS